MWKLARVMPYGTPLEISTRYSVLGSQFLVLAISYQPSAIIGCPVLVPPALWRDRAGIFCVSSSLVARRSHACMLSRLALGTFLAADGGASRDAHKDSRNEPDRDVTGENRSQRADRDSDHDAEAQGMRLVFCCRHKPDPSVRARKSRPVPPKDGGTRTGHPLCYFFPPLS